MTRCGRCNSQVFGITPGEPISCYVCGHEDYSNMDHISQNGGGFNRCPECGGQMAVKHTTTVCEKCGWNERRSFQKRESRQPLRIDSDEVADAMHQEVAPPEWLRNMGR